MSGYKARLPSAKTDVRRTKGGFQYDLLSDRWEIDPGISMGFDYEPWTKFDYLSEFKLCLARYLETHSIAHVENLHNYFAHYLRTQGVNTITLKSLAKWKTDLGHTREYLLGTVRGLIYSWDQWGFNGVPESVVTWLEEQTIRGNEKGRAVRTWCPYSGPYSPTELGWILEWATDSLREKEIGYDTHAALFLLATTGLRPVQLRKLRSKDILATKDDTKGGVVENFVLNAPIAKARISKGYRTGFIGKPVNRAIYLVVANLRDRNEMRLNQMLNEPLTAGEAKEMPLFPSWSRVEKFLKQHKSTKVAFLAEHKERPATFHSTVNDFRSLLTYEFTKTCPLVSEVTGEPLTLSARRFRYTYGTNCARLGLTGVPLASALGHSDTQNIGCYVETSPEIADNINNAMNSGPLIVVSQALAGVLVDAEADALRGDDPRSRIKTDGMQNVGTCGSFDFCPSGWRSCYTCRRFQPWLEAPHGDALTEVLQERQLMIDAGCSPLVIQSSYRLEMAIRTAMADCAQRKAEQQSIQYPT